MSNPEVGSAFVKLRLDPAGFEEQITDTVESGAQQAQDVLDKQVDQQAQKILDLQTRSEAANLRALAASARGDETVAKAESLAAGLLSLQANVRQAQFAAEDSLRSAASAMGSEREQFLAAAEAYATAAKIGQDTIRRSQEAGKLLSPNIPGAQPSALERLEELARGSGTRGGIGQLLAAGGRLGAVGIIATGAFQAFSHLQQALRVTGDEAFTMSGKFRNAGADILTLDLVGAFNDLRNERPAQIIGDLAAKLEEAKQKGDPLIVTQEKLNALYQDSPQQLGSYLEALVGLGKISTQTALEMFKITEANKAIEASARAAELAVGDVAEKIARAGSDAAAFGESSTRFGRGVGGVAAEAAAAAAAGPSFQPGTGGTDVGNTVRELITARIRDDDARLKQELADRKLIEAQVRATFENVKGTEAAGAAYKAVVAATTAVAQTQNQIKDSAEQAAKTAQATREAKAKEAAAAAEKAASDAQQAREIGLQNAIASAALTKRKSDDIKAFNTAIDYYKALAAHAGTALERAQAQQKVIELTAQLSKVKTGADPAAAAELAEARLQNALAAASATGRISDDRKAAQDLVRFWKSQVNDAEGVAKARAEGSLIDAKGRLAAVNQSAIDLQELRIRNRQQAARLTAGTSDDKKAADDLVKFWQNQVNHAEGVAKERAKSNLLAAQLARQSGQKTETGGGPTTIDFLGISQQLAQDFASNLLPTGSASSLAGLFKLPGIEAGAGGQSVQEQQVEELKKIRELLTQKGIGASVNVHQNFRDPDATGFAQARFARLAMEEAFNG